MPGSQASVCAADGPAKKIAPHLTAEAEVEKAYEVYTKRLANDHRVLLDKTKALAPELVARLRREPPRPLATGYQLLPRITPNGSTDEQRAERAGSVSYSWRRTRNYIDRELPRLEELEEQLSALGSVDPSSTKSVLERLISDFDSISENQATIDEHVQYNRFWQRAIAIDRPRFDRLTRLHDAALERQLVRKALEAKDPDEFRAQLAVIQGIHSALPEADVRLELQEKENALTAFLRDHAEKPVAVKFLKFTKGKGGKRSRAEIVHASVYTDIEDKAFLEKVKEAIEQTWQVKGRYALKLDLQLVSPKQLYSGTRPPSRGQMIDLEKHVGRFGKRVPVLTSGANTTYAIPGRYIAFGPQPIAPNVIAHEFGHLLGFVDHYFRGYRDLGSDGFEVLEIIPDPDDLMAAPGFGKVDASHFERLKH